MKASPCEFLTVVELVAKYGDLAVKSLVEEAAEYLLSQGEGFMIAS